MKKIGIVGSRRRNTEQDYRILKNALRTIYCEGDIFVSGGCPKGADNFAEQIAKEFSIPIILHLPEWTRHGRQAGLIRNTYIAQDSDILVALVASDRKGGTEDTIRKFHGLGKTEVVLL